MAEIRDDTLTDEEIAELKARFLATRRQPAMVLPKPPLEHVVHVDTARRWRRWRVEVRCYRDGYRCRVTDPDREAAMRAALKLVAMHTGEDTDG